MQLYSEDYFASAVTLAEVVMYRNLLRFETIYLLDLLAWY
jgi:hypothetical protein